MSEIKEASINKNKQKKKQKRGQLEGEVTVEHNGAQFR